MVDLPAEYMESLPSGLDLSSYIYWRSMGLNPDKAGHRACKSIDPVQRRSWILALERRPEIQEAIQHQTNRATMKLTIEREHVVEGLLEAINVAREQSDPKSMISGWSEVAKIAGVSAESKVQEQPTATLTDSDMAKVSDQVLLKLLGKQRALPPINMDVDTIEDAVFTDVARPT